MTWTYCSSFRTFGTFFTILTTALTNLLTNRFTLTLTFTTLTNLLTAFFFTFGLGIIMIRIIG